MKLSDEKFSRLIRFYRSRWIEIYRIINGRVYLKKI